MTVCMVAQAITPQAATLRSATVITSETVRLSDLFSDLEPGQDRPLGPGPAPGASIQVGGGQLLAIADEYGIDWLDQSPSAMVTITRAGRMLDQSFFAELVRQNLPEIGNGPVAIELHDFHPFVVATDDPKPVVLSDVKWDQHSGWFTATAYRSRPMGDITQDSFMLTGVIHATHRVIVYTRSLPSGTVLSASDIRMNDSYAQRLSGKTFATTAEVEGLTLTHGVVAGEAVAEQDVQRTILLHRGDPVMIAFTAPGLHLTATGRALEDGGAGQYARVLNLMGHMIVTGRVVSASEVEVEQGSGAVPSDSAAMRRLAADALSPPRSDLSLR